jgi:hypothetical protein
MTAEPEKVVFLKVVSDNTREEGIPLLACRRCRNKAFTVQAETGQFPVLECCACGMQIGRFGWVDDEEPE